MITATVLPNDRTESSNRLIQPLTAPLTSIKTQPVPKEKKPMPPKTEKTDKVPARDPKEKDNGAETKDAKAAAARKRGFERCAMR